MPTRASRSGSLHKRREGEPFTTFGRTLLFKHTLLSMEHSFFSSADENSYNFFYCRNIKDLNKFGVYIVKSSAK